MWATATNAMSEVTTVDASLLEMILKAQAGVLKLMERRAKLTGLDAPEKVEEVGHVSDAKATLLAKWNKMAERMRAAEIAAPMKDVTPLIEHEPSADANETSMIRFADADETVTNRDARPAVTPAFVAEVAHVTKRTASRNWFRSRHETIPLEGRRHNYFPKNKAAHMAKWNIV